MFVKVKSMIFSDYSMMSFQNHNQKQQNMLDFFSRNIQRTYNVYLMSFMCLALVFTVLKA